MPEIPITAARDGVTLAGSLWTPDGPPRALVHMHPGSGPSDRDNDVCYPPIRRALLDAGLAVSAFDKRGVGGSTGHWTDAGIEDQAADLVAGLDAAREGAGDLPVAIFGHSQGAWVVIEAASRSGAALVIANSGPAVTPLVQETVSTRNRLRSLGWTEDAVRTGTATFDEAMALTSRPFADGMREAERLPLYRELLGAGVFLPQDEGLWSLTARVNVYEPVPALLAFDRPLLAVHGAEDALGPVELSASVFRERVPAHLLELRVFPGADHRILVGDDFAPGYLDTIVGSVLAHS